jgi:hypothetical protein
MEEHTVGTWGVDAFESDAALDFVDEQIDRFVAIITAVFTDEQRFLLDEDAEGQPLPSVEIQLLLCERCGAVLPKGIEDRCRGMEAPLPRDVRCTDRWAFRGSRIHGTAARGDRERL